LQRFRHGWRLAFERLEDRTMLSASVQFPAPPSTHGLSGNYGPFPYDAGPGTGIWLIEHSNPGGPRLPPPTVVWLHINPGGPVVRLVPPPIVEWLHINPGGPVVRLVPPPTVEWLHINPGGPVVPPPTVAVKLG
jgi:hypothetical protein